VLGSDASGIFGLFDVDSNGNIQPTEITQAYKFMNTKANDNLKQNELLKAMDGEIRAFCGVGPATEAEIKEEQEDEDNDASEDDEEEEEKSRNDRRNKGGRRNRNNKGNKGRGGRGNRGGQDEDEPAVLGEDFDMPKDFKPDEHHDMPKDMKMPEMPKEGEGENYDPSEFEFDANKEPDFSEEKFDFNDEANYEDDGEGGRRLRAGRGKRGRRAQKG